MTEPGTPPPPEDPETGRIQSLREQDARIDGLSEKIDKILGIIGGSPSATAVPETTAADQPSSLAAEIRAQLDKRDADARAAADKDTQSKTLAELAAKVKELSEKPPAEPVRRRHKIMGWNE